MDKIVIHGQKSLSGSVEISGAKNAVLPLMATSLLSQGVTILHKVPNLKDTRTMISLLEMTGAGIEFKDGTLTIDGSTVDTPFAPYELVKTMRASFYVLGPLLARFGSAKVSLPGGCAWGPRPVNFHLAAMEKLGADIQLDEGYINAKAKTLKGNEIHFEIPSVGATGNTIMAAVLAEGTTAITNAAMEPEITQLADVLVQMGSNITGIGTSTLVIQGVQSLTAQEITVIPDRIEAGTFLICGAAIGDFTLHNVEPSHLSIVLEKLKNVGAEISINENSILIKKAKGVKPVDVTTDVYPGFPTDLQAQWIALMTIAEGSSMVTDTVYHDRFSHVPELIRLGANIRVENNVAFVRGKPSLKGANVMSTDIRASASLILGGLFSEGKTDVSRVYHIDRGYENIEQKFRNLGAEISREYE
ncbi:MAG: UDP-N-acetylglucosamine 1-carboxyvinyltransferase [Candidatus Marinimicrobia bacterium]|jgi:UDP-N-acetylglucosamine 1-carboxyvinyltransferase|nr:UDP-N-acetylglucosamine 1-carboxyvinyltransferase [Candidatus Neomarinimicrobiota bacterium]MBT3618582.1 UDP-N-acetylglucosamine 1-carboxyvinyltransferase [Candidatus Neomarinimicrobiota bacterium]MBT3828809.1 UDP-N-acetylglucosamine 1-carboxyvinyltransferase [Candidatus Neomarinimicrobiota bacterium]MBT3996829.1 UDP-N-acetylglucosamine 1-carboxyvinyltransferase [Candidatus Neomarinimicrobiota bacterium]MBT4281020.1 UDP-N-acetylglucosamine 1-carboxyvinyltransferase [Candidatus Neomarinimicro